MIAWAPKNPQRWPIFHHHHHHLSSSYILLIPLSSLLSFNLCITLPLGLFASLILVCLTLSLCISPYCISFPFLHSFFFSLSVSVSLSCCSSLSLSVTQIIQYCRCQLETSRSPPTLANTPLAKRACIDAHLQTHTHQGDVSMKTLFQSPSTVVCHTLKDMLMHRCMFQDSTCQNMPISTCSNCRQSSSYFTTFSLCLCLNLLEFLSFPLGLPPLSFPLSSRFTPGRQLLFSPGLKLISLKLPQINKAFCLCVRVCTLFVHLRACACACV